MKEELFKIESNTKIAENPRTGDVFKMILSGNTEEITSPGQFVNIAIPGRYLRRPISVCDIEKDKLTLVYKVVGKGTSDLGNMSSGDSLNILTGLGNGFDVKKAGKKPLLIGGGIGSAPLYYLAKELEKSSEVTVVLGFKNASEMILKEAFEKLGAKVYIATEDGSMGTKGFVTDILRDMDEYTCIYTCGPAPMFRALHRSITKKVPAEFSLEERMGCGFGACMGCSIETRNGAKRVCKDGPVFEMEELIWED